MRTSTKVWYGLGVCAIATAAGVTSVNDSSRIAAPGLVRSAAAASSGGESGEAAQPPINEYPGDFDKALQKAFGGEGGEHGVGMSTMWPRLWIPALTSEQIEKVVTGNTLRNDDKIAVYFDENGTATGWFVDWEQDEIEKCPAEPYQLGDDWSLEEEGTVCWRKDVHEMAGSWDIRNHKLCTSLRETGYGKAFWYSDDKCWHVAMVLGNIAMFDETGEIEGKAKYLKQGEALDMVADKTR